jgi:hypothetical protein
MPVEQSDVVESYHESLNVTDTPLVDELIKRSTYLLDDVRSPILSTLKSTEKYSKSLAVDAIDQYKGNETAFLKNPIDIDLYERDNDKLVVLNQEMERLSHKLMDAAEFMNENEQAETNQS